MSIVTASIPVPAAGEGAFVDVSAMVGPKTVVFSGQYQGAYELLGSHDDSRFVPILQFDAGGVEGVRQTISGSFKSMRLRAATPATSPGSGVTCEVSAVAGAGQNYFATVASLAAGASPGLTPVVDLAPLFPPTGPEEDICFLCEGGLLGQLVVLGSLDGVEFCPVGSFRRDRVPEGAPISAEFSVLPSPDKIRYVRLSLDGEAGGAMTVTVGGRVPSSAGASQTLAQTYAVGSLPADQTMVILDSRGGSVVIDASTPPPLNTGSRALGIDVLGGSTSFHREGGLDVYSTIARSAAGASWNEVYLRSSTLALAGAPSALSVLSMVRVGRGTIDGPGNVVDDAYDLLVDASPTGTATLTRSWSIGATGAVQVQVGLVIGAGLAPPGEPDLVIGAGATVVSEADSGRLGYLAGGTQQLMVSLNGGAYVPVLYGPMSSGFSAGNVPFGNGVDGQLAQDSAIVWDSVGTLLLGGAGSLPSSTLRVRSTLFISPSSGTTWNGVTVEASTLTLSGGPATVTQLSMARVEQATIDTLGFVNTVSDAYDLLVDAAPVGTATLTRSWSIGAAGAVQAQAGLTIGAGISPPGEADLAVGPGATVVSEANTGRLGYLAGAAQQFMASMNGGAYVPLLAGPAAAGFTAGSVSFGIAGGQLGQDNANLFWDNANKRLGIDVAASPTARLHLAGVTVVAGTSSLKIDAGTLLGATESGAVESDGTHLYWTDAGGTRLQLDGGGGVSTLAASYAAGAVAADQTLVLLDARGGGLVVDGTSGSFTGTNALEILGSSSGTVLFPRAGGLRVDATTTVASAVGASWNGVDVVVSTLTLSGAATPVTSLSLVNMAGPIVAAASPVVVADFYVARIGTASFAGAGPASSTRSWSLYAEDSVRLGAGQTVFGRQILVGASPYAVRNDDYVLEVQSNGGAITVNLPALTGGAQLNGRIVVVKDSGYSAAVNNITLVPGNAADKIENGAAGASYTMDVSGQCLWLKANLTNVNWEII